MEEVVEGVGGSVSGADDGAVAALKSTLEALTLVQGGVGALVAPA